MKDSTDFQDFIAFHPGYYLRDYIETNGMTIENFAHKIGIDEETLTLLLKGELDLDVKTIDKIADVTNTSADFWLELQMDYDNLVASFKEKMDE